MTAPISFPNIAPPQQAQPDSRSQDFADLARLLVGIAQHREAVALQKKQLDLEQQRTASSLETDAAQRKAAQQEYEAKQNILDAEDVANRYVSDFLTTPGGPTEDAYSALLTRIASENKKNTTNIISAFRRQVADQVKLATDFAQTRKTQSEARVQTTTEPEQIHEIQQRALLVAQQLTNEQIRQHILTDDITHAPQRRIEPLLQGGATLGTAYEINGYALPPELEHLRNWTLPGAKGGNDTGSEARQQANAQLAIFHQGRLTAETAGDLPLKTLGEIRGLLAGKGLAGITAEMAGKMFSSSKQKQVLDGYRSMGLAARFFLSGKQSTVGEDRILMMLLAPLAGDSISQRVAKAKLANAVEEGIAKVAGQQLSPTDAVNHMIQVAKSTNAPNDAMRQLGILYQAAANFEKTDEYKGRTGQPVAGGVDTVVAKNYRAP